MINSIKKKLRSLSKYDFMMRLRLRYRLVKQNLLHKKYPDDKDYIEMFYKKTTGRELDLKNPKRFTEKTQWLKLNDRKPLCTICADKYAVREYIEKTGHGELLNELLAVYDNADEIDVDKLPDKFVLKATHGSSMNLICKDKKSINWKSKKKIFNLWLKINIYLDGREWAYKDIKPRIIAEKYLEDDSGNLRDYKFFCFNGKPKIIQVDEDRYSDHRQAYYTTSWEKYDFYLDCKTCDLERPKMLDEMLKIAEDLSSPFRFVRVDLYNCNNKIYFGELTFYDASGFYSFHPDKYDFIFGDMLPIDDAEAEK